MVHPQAIMGASMDITRMSYLPGHKRCTYPAPFACSFGFFWSKQCIIDVSRIS
ncbi:hypothetical protein Lalb_Chr05g0226451 [Lupinus albus]|uniref:Uncharacterized protein n=1 Tax=Lupinus albus TaxID=3870 RepID=A0A6A4QJE0_LUPAL|nr:hypothetical protein Lalb_Chr05g0226451 [Lupinus albus]